MATVVHPSDSAAVAEAAPVRTSLATLLAGHILSDGEIVLMILKPSPWFILLSCARFIAAVLIGMIAAKVFDHRLPYTTLLYIEVGIFLLAGRIMWSVLNWMGRYYILTDLRIVRLTGVFNVDVYDCSLRKIARTRLVYTTKERLLRLGSIEILPSDESCSIGLWQTIAHPKRVHDQIVSAINRAKQGGRACHV